MQKIIKIAIVLLGISPVLQAQTFTSSPYSRYGLGELSTSSQVVGLSMGGVNIALRDNHSINFYNPASYTAVDSLSFLFDVSVLTRFTRLETNSQSLLTSGANFNSFALAFPITSKWSCSMGLIPFSTVGYKITEIIVVDTMLVRNTYEGNGGINRFYMGHAYQIGKGLSVGANISYLFGSLDRNASAVFPEEGYVFDYYSSNRVIVNGLYCDLGLQYETKISSGGWYLGTGLNFEPSIPVNAKNTNLVTKYLNIGGTVTLDTIENVVNSKGKLRYPLGGGLGFSIRKDEKLTIYTDFRFRQWSKLSFFGENDSLSDSYGIAAGLDFIPGSENAGNYFRRMHVRLGGHYDKTCLSFHGEDIVDLGFSFGLGLPVGRLRTMPNGKSITPSHINLAFSFGQRGTLANDLIRERYAMVTINLSLYDIWFIKRKFD